MSENPTIVRPDVTSARHRALFRHPATKLKEPRSEGQFVIPRRKGTLPFDEKRKEYIEGRGGLSTIYGSTDRTMTS
jgi:hypothetical protein